MAEGSDRAEALRRLAEFGVKSDPTAVRPEAPQVKSTGNTVEAGGDVERVLIRPTHLTYRDGGDLVHAFAEVGDTVLITAAQAERLDGLGATVEPGTDLAEAAADDTVTDEQLRAMSAADLVAHVAQHPEDRDRVHRIESEGKARKTVLDATAPEDGDDPDEELD